MRRAGRKKKSMDPAAANARSASEPDDEKLSGHLLW